MRICHINLAREVRGGESQTLALVQALGTAAGDGLSQRLVVRRGAGLERRARQEAGVEVLGVPNRLLAVARATAGCDVVHVHEGRALLPALLAGLLHGRPYVVTRRVPRVPHANPVTRLAYRRAGAVAAVSAAVADGMRRYDPALQVEVINDCVPPRIGMPGGEPPPDKSGALVVGHVGALVDSQKGQAILIDTAREIAASHPQVKFWLLGDGADEAVLRRRADGLGNVRFCGWVPNVGDYYRAMDLFAFPSRHEALGSAILEAMHHGLPVVAARTGGIPEVVAEGETGLLFEPGDASDFRQALLRLVDDPPLRRRMGEAALARGRNYAADAMAARYLDLYRKLVT